MDKTCIRCGAVFFKRGTCSRRAWAKSLYCSRACDFADRVNRPRNPITEERTARNFWRRVDKTDERGCWLWSGPVNKGGYGVTNAFRMSCMAHRLSWSLEHMAVPLPGFVVRHMCGVRRCVRPDHLRLGTPEENVQDAIDAGTIPRGESNGLSKLTDDAVREIRAMRAAGHTYKELGIRHGVSSQAARSACIGATWKHI